MKVYRGLNGLQNSFSSPAVTLGNFDGVHLGHKHLFERLKKKALDLGGQALVLTFDPHPVRVLRPEMSPPLITSLDQKIKLLDENGIDGVILAEFTKKFASQHPASFVNDILSVALNAGFVLVGHDFTFGKGKEGTIESLKSFGKQAGFEVEVTDALTLGGEIISSTRIREFIKGGNVKKAASFLGRPHNIEGLVVKGRGRGKSLGFPTANIDFKAELIPQDGVYAVNVVLEGQRYKGISNIGMKPTFGDEDRSVEVHIFDFDESLYGKNIDLLFLDRIRGEIRFENQDSLANQIKKDILLAEDMLKKEL